MSILTRGKATRFELFVNYAHTTCTKILYAAAEIDRTDTILP